MIVVVAVMVVVAVVKVFIIQNFQIKHGTNGLNHRVLHQEKTDKLETNIVHQKLMK